MDALILYTYRLLCETVLWFYILLFVILLRFMISHGILKLQKDRSILSLVLHIWFSHIQHFSKIHRVWILWKFHRHVDVFRYTGNLSQIREILLFTFILRKNEISLQQYYSHSNYSFKRCRLLRRHRDIKCCSKYTRQSEQESRKLFRYCNWVTMNVSLTFHKGNWDITAGVVYLRAKVLRGCGASVVFARYRGVTNQSR